MDLLLEVDCAFGVDVLHALLSEDIPVRIKLLDCLGFGEGNNEGDVIEFAGHVSVFTNFLDDRLGELDVLHVLLVEDAPARIKLLDYLGFGAWERRMR